MLGNSRIKQGGLQFGVPIKRKSEDFSVLNWFFSVVYHFKWNRDFFSVGYRSNGTGTS